MSRTAADAAAVHGGPWRLCLYVAGQSPKSLDAFANLKAICEKHLPGQYEIEIVDLVEHPTLAATDDVIAVPTLVRRLPPPSRKMIGNLSDTERVMGYLAIPEKASQ